MDESKDFFFILFPKIKECVHKKNVKVPYKAQDCAAYWPKLIHVKSITIAIVLVFYQSFDQNVWTFLLIKTQTSNVPEKKNPIYFREIVKLSNLFWIVEIAYQSFGVGSHFIVEQRNAFHYTARFDCLFGPFRYALKLEYFSLSKIHLHHVESFHLESNWILTLSFVPVQLKAFYAVYERAWFF